MDGKVTHLALYDQLVSDAKPLGAARPTQAGLEPSQQNHTVTNLEKLGAKLR